MPIPLAEFIGFHLSHHGHIEINCLRCEGKGELDNKDALDLLCPCCKGKLVVTDAHVAGCIYCNSNNKASLVLGEKLLKNHAAGHDKHYTKKKAPASNGAKPSNFRLGRE